MKNNFESIKKYIEIDDDDFNKLDIAIQTALEIWENEIDVNTEFEKFSWVRGFIWGYMINKSK